MATIRPSRRASLLSGAAHIDPASGQCLEISAYRIRRMFDGRAWWKRSEWRRSDGTAHIGSWTRSAPAPSTGGLLAEIDTD